MFLVAGNHHRVFISFQLVLLLEPKGPELTLSMPPSCLCLLSPGAGEGQCFHYFRTCREAQSWVGKDVSERFVSLRNPTESQRVLVLQLRPDSQLVSDCSETCSA